MSSAPLAGPSSTTPLERFWRPPPSSTSSLPAIRRSLESFPSPALRVSRVAQLDASLLDNELEGILSAPVWKALEGLRTPGRRSWEPEMMALLRIAVLKMSLYDRGATYGSTLQNLKYRNEWKHGAGFQSTAIDSSLLTIQKAAYLTLLVLPSYLHARLRDRMLSSSWADDPLPRTWFSLISPFRKSDGDDDLRKAEWRRVVWELLNVGERIGAVAGLVNFLVFLYDGRYRTLVDRILGMRLIYAQRSITPNVSFEFLNRQLVWEAFTEFLLFMVPLVNVHRLRTRISRMMTKSRALTAVVSSLPAPVAKSLRLSRPPPVDRTVAIDPTKRPQGPFHFLSPTTCPVCYAASNAPPTSLPSDPTSATTSTPGTLVPATGSDTSVKLPYITDCGWGCRYCYYCVVGKLAACEEDGEESWKCDRCGENVNAVTREVTEESKGDAEVVLNEKDGAEGKGNEVETETESESVVGEEHAQWRE